MLVDVARPVEVKGHLIQHLVVLLLLLFLQKGLFGAALELVRLGEAKVPVHGQQVHALVRLFQQRGGKGHLKGLLGLAAA